MTLTVNLILTEQMKEKLASDGRVRVFKDFARQPSIDPEKHLLLSPHNTQFCWQPGWNEADGKHPTRRWGWRRTLQEGGVVAAGVLHAYLNVRNQERFIPLWGYEDDFVAAGYGHYSAIGSLIQVAFRRLYLEQGVYDQAVKRDPAKEGAKEYDDRLAVQRLVTIDDLQQSIHLSGLDNIYTMGSK